MAVEEILFTIFVLVAVYLLAKQHREQDVGQEKEHPPDYSHTPSM